MVKIKITLNDTYTTVYRNGNWAVPFGTFLVRWFPANWTLAERKERGRFQASIVDIPDSMTDAALFSNRTVSSFIATSGAKFFKIIMEPNKKRKLIGYFSSWDELQTCHHTPQRWNDIDVNWIRHSSPPPRSRFRQNTNFSSRTPVRK